MIRINLLPIKKERRRTSAKREMVIFAVLALLTFALMTVLYLSNSSAVDELRNMVAAQKVRLEEDKQSIGDTPEQEKKKEALEQQLAVLNDLQKRRSGPVRVLDELQEILSPPRNREAQLLQAQKNWNVDWDTRRLWINDLKENGGAFSMTGSAENADDVAEFLRRLETAEHFSNIQLQFVQAQEANRRTGLPRIVNYSLTGNISYAPLAPKETEEKAPQPGDSGGTQ